MPWSCPCEFSGTREPTWSTAPPWHLGRRRFLHRKKKHGDYTHQLLPAGRLYEASTGHFAANYWLKTVIPPWGQRQTISREAKSGLGPRHHVAGVPPNNCQEQDHAIRNPQQPALHASAAGDPFVVFLGLGTSPWLACHVCSRHSANIHAVTLGYSITHRPLRTTTGHHSVTAATARSLHTYGRWHDVVILTCK